MLSSAMFSILVLFMSQSWIVSAYCFDDYECGDQGYCFNHQCKYTCTPSCENGGTCSSFGVCDCIDEYYGSYCQYTYSDTCTPSCENGGTCRFGSCDCTDEYYGSHCQYTYSDTCTPSCENGGTCSFGICDCTDEHYGSYCQYTYSGVSSTPGIIAGCLIGGIFLFGCTFCIVFLRIWLRVRMATRPRSTRPVIPVTGRRVVVITQGTNTVTRPPGAPPPYMPPQETPHPQTSESNSTTPGPTPPYSGPSPLYSGPSAPEWTPPNPNTGPTPPYSGPSPSYSGPVEPIIPDKDENDDGDDVPLLSGN